MNSLAEFARLERLRSYLSLLDWHTGRTKHTQVYRGFLRAASLGVSEAVATALVREYVVFSGGLLDEMQMRRQQLRAYDFVQRTATHSSVGGRCKAQLKQSSIQRFRPELLSRIASSVGRDDMEQLVQRLSPVPPAVCSSGEFLRSLYNHGEKVVVFTRFKSQGQIVFDVSSTNDDALPAGGDEGVWFLTNPVDGQFYPNPRQGGKLSRRSEESIVAWRYLLIESDQVDAATWLKLLIQIPLRIVAIYSSGGKSLHALVKVEAISKSAWDECKSIVQPILVALGADPAALSAVRLSRLPQCFRGAKQQMLLYLNPSADGRPILVRDELSQNGGDQ